MLKIIQELEKYMQDFIEKAHSAFNGFPICPFAKEVRKQKRIDYQVGPFSLDSIPEILSKIEAFKSQDQYDLIMFVHPDKEGLTPEALDKIIEQVSQQVNPDCIAFGGHPLDPFMINGVHTRQDPYPNFQVIKKQKLSEAQNILKNTKYYGD